MAILLSLDSSEASLANSGGKAANLARMISANLPVPAGFVLTTTAYQQYVGANGLGEWILREVESLSGDNPSALEEASIRIRERFRQGELPANLVDAVGAAYDHLGKGPVAVRSSATAEDLPSASFAGQQDTFLNVLGEDSLLDAVVECFSSLWTARAIGYRIRYRISHADVLMAVVVQEMAPSDASGVLFTANPLSGRRDETVIDAVYGLGEALVSGQVEPDHYVVDTVTGELVEKRIGAKALAIHSQDGGGTFTVTSDGRTDQAIPDRRIVELTALGRTVADLFQSPQDVEWALAGGCLYLLQSRPITSLFPLPAALTPQPPQLFFSFGAVQGMLDPMTPTGRDTIIAFFVSVGRHGFGYDVTSDNQHVFMTSAERLWINFTPLARNRIGHHVLTRFFGFIDPGAEVGLSEMLKRSELAGGFPRPTTIFRLLRFLSPILIGILATFINPEKQRRKRHECVEQAYADFSDVVARARSKADVAPLLQRMADSQFTLAISQFLPLIAVGMSSMALLNRLARHLPDGQALVLTATRGLPHNVTTAMDLALWDVARAIREDPEGSVLFTSWPADELAVTYLRGTLPSGTQAAISQFLDQYGMRGLAEIDIGRSRWREEPTQIMETLRSYLQITDPEKAPDLVFTKGKLEAEAALEELAGHLRQTRFGRLKAHLVRTAGRRMRAVAGHRESPKFLIVRVMGQIRQALLAVGSQMSEQGRLNEAGDIFFLHRHELGALATGAGVDWRELVNARRRTYDREMCRRRIPHLLLSDGSAYYESTGAGAGAGDLSGTPVSPGVVEGLVKIILRPHETQLHPGEILVCPGTDPAWTPLFLAAGGLITEVGGLMTHGSVVAREYGIPAVVGVHAATTRLETGQRIRLDGSTGQITLLSSVGLGQNEAAEP